MKQSRRASLIETILNTAVGYCINLVVQMIVFPIFGFHVSLTGNVIIGAIFTVVSIIRSFVMRRLFENLRVHGILP